MGFIRRLLLLVGTVIAIGVTIWLSITIFAVLLVVGGVAVLVMAGRQFLVARGILNPRPGVPFEPEADITVIDGEFEVENPMIGDSEEK